MSLAQRRFFRTLCSIQVEQIENCKEKLFNPDASIKVCFLFHHTPADCYNPDIVVITVFL